MDFTFSCPKCSQDFVGDHTMGGSTIDCPSCNARITVPQPSPEVLAAAAQPPPVSTSEGEKHFVVPMHEGPTEILIQKPKPTLDVAREERDKKLRLKTIRRQECMTVGKDHFDEVVSEFLQHVGKDYLISITPITYTYADLAGSKSLITDYGVMIVFRG